jgi:hypothetical protein
MRRESSANCCCAGSNDTMDPWNPSRRNVRPKPPSCAPTSMTTSTDSAERRWASSAGAVPYQGQRRTPTPSRSSIRRRSHLRLARITRRICESCSFSRLTLFYGPGLALLDLTESASHSERRWRPCPLTSLAILARAVRPSAQVRDRRSGGCAGVLGRGNGSRIWSAEPRDRAPPTCQASRPESLSYASRGFAHARGPFTTDALHRWQLSRSRR